jgi:nitroreductase
MKPVTDPMQLFRHQRAVREFADRPVDDETVGQVLQAAVHAPSGSNSQPWKFIVVRDAGVRAELDRIYAEVHASTTPGVMSKAPVVIVPCVKVPERTGVVGFQTGASIYPACQNLMLAARLLGLGTVLTTSHRQKNDDVKSLLGVPETWDTAALIPLGWPDRSYGPNHRPPLDQAMCLDRWSE